MFLPAETIKFRLKTEARMSLCDVAKKLGRHPSTVSLVLNGTRKSWPVIVAVAEILGDDPDDLASFLLNDSTVEEEVSS